MPSKRKKPSVVGLFSGCGGLDLGFKQAGFDWYKKKGMPSEPELTDIYSDFFNKDMIYCVEINEEFGPGSKKN
tara:strand:+ start:99 stop:317 length:219 start_codon:yes stop_codon:yes gene_type:complete